MSAIAWMTPATALERNTFGSSSDDEADVLRDWLLMVRDRYERVAFYVRLGEGRTTPPSDELSIQRMWRALTQYRADALAMGGGVVDVVEVKLHARIQAVTQVRFYAALAAAELHEAASVRPMIICRSCDAAVDTAIRNLNGRVELVPRHMW